MDTSIDGEPWSPCSGRDLSEVSELAFDDAQSCIAVDEEERLRRAVRPPIRRKPRIQGLELGSIRHTPWRKEGEALQVPFTTRIAGQALLVGVGDAAVTAFFSLIALGADVIVVLSDLSNEMANAVALNLPGALMVDIDDVKELDFKEIFKRRSVAATFVGGSDRGEFLVEYFEQFDVPVIYWACAECLSGASDEPSN